MGQQSNSEEGEDVFVEGEVIADLEGQEATETGPEGEQEEGEVDVDDSFHCFTGHDQSVFTVAWNPADPLLIASGGQDEVAYLWRTCGIGEAVVDELTCQKLEGHSDSVISVCFNHDGSLLSTAAMDGTIRIWSVDGICSQTLDGPSDSINWMCWHPQGNVVLAGSSDASAWMWNAQTGICMQVFSGHAGVVTCGSFSEDGKTIITTGDDADPSIKIWNPRMGECTATIGGHGFHEAGINCLDLKSGGQLALTGSADRTARLCHIPNGQAVATLSGHEDSVEAVVFAESGFSALITAGLDGKAIVWDGATLSRRQMHQHPDSVACMDVFNDSPLFVTGCLDGILRLWDVRIPTCAKESGSGRSAIQCLSVVSASHAVIAGSDDASVRVHDMRV